LREDDGAVAKKMLVQGHALVRLGQEAGELGLAHLDRQPAQIPTVFTTARQASYGRYTLMVGFCIQNRSYIQTKASRSNQSITMGLRARPCCGRLCRARR
jgi:hypothetical protein